MSEEDKIQKFFRGYFTQSKIKQDFAQKIIKQAELFETKLRHKEFLDKFFDSLRKSYDPKHPKNFVTASKRFLFIINKLLGEGIKKEKQAKYNQLISSQIVRYYLFFFEIIFKDSLHELIVDLKMYRMKWARLITDRAFINLKQQIMKKHNNFNLDRGFSEENMLKLKKIHQKRGLTPKQSNFYLGIEEKEQLNEATPQKHSNRSSDSSSQESDNEYQNRQKKVKTQNNGYTQPNYQIPGYSQYGGFNPGYMTNPPTYEPQHFPTQTDPRIIRPNYEGAYRPNAPSNMSNVYPYEQNQPEISPQSNASTYPYPPTQYGGSHFGYSNYPVPPEPMKPQTQYESKKVPQQVRPEFTPTNLYKIQKMRKELQQGLFKCRQCGECFQTGENHHKHMNEHFFNSLERINEAELKGKIKKENKSKLMDIKSWVTAQKPIEKEEYRFEVLMNELPDQKGEKVCCYFCSQELEISFSPKYEDWVLKDAIKINDEGQVNIIHFNCYESFKSDQNSSVST